MTIDCLLHVHSSFSYDSTTDLADIAQVARQQGISCVLMSEHNNKMTPADVKRLVSRCQELSDDRLLIIPGLELSFDHNFVHLLAFGVTEYIDSFAEGCTFRSLVDAVHRAGGVAVLAHPSHKHAWLRVSRDDLAAVDGIEIWNVKNGNRFFPNPDDVALLTRLRARSGQFAYAGLDWHHLNRFTRLVLQVDAPALTRQAIFDALRRGAYRISSGSRTVPSTGRISTGTLRVYDALSTALRAARTRAYRWQTRLEANGFATPSIIKSAARRVFS